MGVSGSGKTTVARAVARASGAVMIDADDLHPPSNLLRLASGVPLDDAAREPWLDLLVAAIAARRGDRLAPRQPGSPGSISAPPLVVACSALRRAYRDRLRQAGPLGFVFLDVPEAELRRRLDTRSGHYMPVDLLADQLAVLERPGPDEPDVQTLDGAAPLDALVTAILADLPR